MPRPHAVTRVIAGLEGNRLGDGKIDRRDIQTVIQHIHGISAKNTINANCNNDATIDVRDVLCLNKLLSNNSGVGSTRNYIYDNNGNMTRGNGRTVTYTPFNKPESITANGKTLNFSYDDNNNRLTKTDSSNNTTTTYISKLYEKETRGTNVTHRYYLSGVGKLVTIFTKEGNGSTRAQYVHSDRLGSTDVITDPDGSIAEDHAFDAWGLARAANWGAGAAQGFDANTRGYTGHEMDAEIGLINMNARLYDPELRRFITADSVIPDLYNPQSLNRYSYVLNNPLRFTDPSGNVPFEQGTFDAYGEPFLAGDSLYLFSQPDFSLDFNFLDDAGLSNLTSDLTGVGEDFSFTQTPMSLITSQEDADLALFMGMANLDNDFSLAILDETSLDINYFQLIDSTLHDVGAVGQNFFFGTINLSSSAVNFAFGTNAPQLPEIPYNAGWLNTEAAAAALILVTKNPLKGFSDRGTLFDNVFSSKAPKHTTPGTKMLEGQYINDQGRVEPWKARYDDYGRQVGRTDYNAGNKAQDIPSTHHHTKEYNARYPEGRSTGDHIQGEYKP